MQYNFLKHEICGYNYEIIGTEERFISPDEAARIIMEPREIYSCYGNKCERIERDLRGRVVFYSAIFWCGHDTRVLQLTACYNA